MLWLVLLAGLAIGVSLGALGGGGAVLTVPVLVHLAGQDPHAAATGSLVVVGITSLVALAPHARAGRVRWQVGGLLGVLGLGGAYAGSLLSAHVSPQLLMGAFGALMLLVAGLMVVRSHGSEGPQALREDHPILTVAPFRCDCPRALKVAVVASAVGLLTGFFGVGGGFLIVPALVLVLGLPMPLAVGTSLLVIALNSATSLAMRLGHGVELDWGLLAAVTGLAVLGSLLGARLGARVFTATLQRSFAVLLGILGVAVAVPALL